MQRQSIYSGRSDDESIARAMKLGACDYIIKGTDWTETYQRIRAHLPQSIDAVITWLDPQGRTIATSEHIW